MKPSICICCGEPMMEYGNALSRNPNICASCSSLADGITDSDVAAYREANRAKTSEEEPSKDLPRPVESWWAR